MNNKYNVSHKYGLLIWIYAVCENLRTSEKTSIVIIKVRQISMSYIQKLCLLENR